MLAFDPPLVSTGNAESCRAGSVVLKGKHAVYEVRFSANVSMDSPGDARLSIALDGDALHEATMVNSISSAGVIVNASASTLVRTGDRSRELSVVNSGSSGATVSNPSLIVKRVC